MWTASATPTVTIRLGTWPNIMSSFQPKAPMKPTVAMTAIWTIASGANTPTNDRRKSNSRTPITLEEISCSLPFSASMIRL